LPVPPPPMLTTVTRSLFFPSLLNQVVKVSVGAAARTGGRPRGACGEGGTTGAADLLSLRTLAPPFGLVTGPFLPTMRGRRPAPVRGSSPGACCIALMRYTWRYTWRSLPGDQLPCSRTSVARFLNTPCFHGLSTSFMHNIPLPLRIPWGFGLFSRFLSVSYSFAWRRCGVGFCSQFVELDITAPCRRSNSG
jgi:hypothetical protein